MTRRLAVAGLRSILSLALTVVALILGAGAPAEFSVALPTAANQYTYDRHHYTASAGCTDTERGPPAVHDFAIAHVAVGPWPHGASARRDAATPPFSSAYDFPSLLVQFDRKLGTTEGQARLPDGHLCSHSGTSVAVKTAGALVDAGKYDYLFGNVALNAHNAARSAQNAQQLARIGVYDNAAGRSLLQGHFDEVVASGNNIARTYTNQYGTFQVRDSLFSGPGGFLKFESTWQVADDGLRLTTVIPLGGR